MAATEQAAPLDAEPGSEADPISITMDKRVDLALSIAVVAAGAYIIHLASQFKVGTFPDPVTARGLPYFTGGFMVVAGLFNAGRRIVTWSNIPGNYTVAEGAADDVPEQPSSNWRSFAMVGLAFAWALLLHPVGYLLITPPVLFAMTCFMNVRSWAKRILFPIGFTLFIWTVFSQVLGIIIPLGPLTALFRSWGLTP
jgi:hypothetical protein